jgi:putative FmdB family regulatory protein
LRQEQPLPIYEYECQKCHHRFEKIQQYSDAPETKCPKCRGKLEKVITAPSVQFKGSGWYVNDYGRGKASSGSSSKHDSGSESGKVESSAEKSESKSESKTESKSDSKSDKKK